MTFSLRLYVLVKFVRCLLWHEYTLPSISPSVVMGIIRSHPDRKSRTQIMTNKVKTYINDRDTFLVAPYVGSTSAVMYWDHCSDSEPSNNDKRVMIHGFLFDYSLKRVGRVRSTLSRGSPRIKTHYCFILQDSFPKPIRGRHDDNGGPSSLMEIHFVKHPLMYFLATNRERKGH